MVDVQIGDVWCRRDMVSKEPPIGRVHVTDVQTLHGIEVASLLTGWGKDAGAAIRLPVAALASQYVLRARNGMEITVAPVEPGPENVTDGLQRVGRLDPAVALRSASERPDLFKDPFEFDAAVQDAANAARAVKEGKRPPKPTAGTKPGPGGAAKKPGAATDADLLRDLDDIGF